MCAQALLTIAAARPAPPATQPPAACGTGKPEAWRDTGKLPANAGDQPPGEDPGLVKVSVTEARLLLHLATAPMSRAARGLGYAWHDGDDAPGPRPMAPLPQPAAQSRPRQPIPQPHCVTWSPAAGFA
jgi:hypothetical protein